MQPRRFETKEAILTSAPRLAEQRNCIHEAEKWTSAGGAALSWLTVSPQRRARSGRRRVPVVVLDFIYMCSSQIQTDKRKDRSQSMSDYTG